MKKTICLITNWYPSRENPYQGVFFKEQAFALSDEYDFLVVHYREIMGNRKARNQTCLVNEERNTVEYDVCVRVPIRVILADLLYQFKCKYISHLHVDGVGQFTSESRRKFTKKRIVNAFRNQIKRDFDALYCVDAQREAFYLNCVAEDYQKPCVIGEHAPVPWPGTVLSDVNKEAIEKAELFLAISYDKIRQMLLQNIKLPPVQYIGNLVDETRFTLKKDDREKHAGKTLMIAAAHSFYKNYDMFIRVMERLYVIAGQPFRVLIVGYASNKGYSEGTKEFEERIRNSSISGITELVPEVPHAQIRDFYHKADAFVMTSIQEGQPVSALEAACCGLPVFSTRCGGVEDYVDDKIGRIYAVSDVEGMAQGLKDYLEDKITFDAEHIRNTVINRFGKKAFTDHYKHAFQTVMK